MYGFGSRWIVTEGTVWTDGVILPSPPFCQDISFYERIEALTVEQLIPQLLVEKLDETVLSGTSYSK